MKTAKTLQLLDANNNNISPAVCVDSLYFEQSLDDGTYRMSLRNRILVAAESMDLNLGVSGAQDLEAVEIPYFYANAATGTGGTVYELHTGRYELGKKIAKAFKAYGDLYYLNKNAAGDYIHINGDNGATDTLNVGWSNGLRSESVIIKAANASSNIMFGNAGANGYIKVSTTDKKMTVDAKNQFDVSATIIHTNSQDFVLTATGNTTVQTNKLNVNSSYEGNITTGALLTLNSNKGIDILSNITAADNNINIRGYNVNIDTATEGKITLYGKTFPRPIALDSNTQQLPFLRQNNANAMEWGFLPTLVVKDFINTGRINFLADTAGGTNGNNPSPNYAKYYISMKHLSFK